MQLARRTEIGVGIFMLAALAAAVFISLRIASGKLLQCEPIYHLYASFDNINGLKLHSPVKIGGVVVGKIDAITLDPSTYRPYVRLAIAKRYSHIPETSILASHTSGLLGEKYLAILPGFIDADTAMLQEGDTFEETQSSILLEDLVSQLLYLSPKAK